MLHRLVLFVLLFTVVGCDEGEFSGSHNELRFTSNLGAPWRKFTPTTLVATGSMVRLEAVDLVDSGGPTVPEATVTVEDSSRLLDEVTVDVDVFQATVARAGTTTITFAGVRTDDVVLVSAPVVRGALVDPVRDFGVASGFVAPEIAARIPNVTSPLALTAGTRLTLGAALFAQDGPVATNRERVGFAAAGDVEILGGDHLVTMTAPATAGGHGQVSVVLDGTAVGAIDVDIHDANDAAALELIQVRSLGAVVAVVRLADGSVLWQPPIAWELGEQLSLRDQAPLGTELVGEPFDPVRTDVVLYSVLRDGPAGVSTTPVTARVGGLEATIVLTIERPVERPAPPAPESCSASSTPPWWAASLLLLRLVRSRRTLRL
jgi:hypothetical protein